MNIDLVTLMAPKIPAMIIHIRKKAEARNFHIGSEIIAEQISPAPRNPFMSDYVDII